MGRWPCLSDLVPGQPPHDREETWALPVDDGSRTGNPFRRGWRATLAAGLLDRVVVVDLDVTDVVDLLAAVDQAAGIADDVALAPALCHEVTRVALALPRTTRRPDVARFRVCEALAGTRLVVAVAQRPVLVVCAVTQGASVVVQVVDSGVVLEAFRAP